jgi:hypothetical protein
MPGLGILFVSRDVSMESAVSIFTVDIISPHNNTRCNPEVCDLNCQRCERHERDINVTVCGKSRIQRRLQYFVYGRGRRTPLFNIH